MSPPNPTSTTAPDEAPPLRAPEPAGLHPAVLVVIALAVVMVLTVVLGLWHLRRDTLTAQSRNLASLASSAADELERGLQGVALALQATRDDLREARLVPGQPEAAAQLHRRAGLLTLVRKLWVIDRGGNVLAASSTAAAPALTSFHPALDTLGDVALALSEPFTDLATHELSVAAAMRFVQPDGQPGGWVLAELPAASLLGAFPASEPSSDARLVVWRADGVRLAGSLAQRSGGAEIELSTLGVAVGDAAAEVVAGEAATGSMLDAITPGARRLPDGSERLVQRRTLQTFGVHLAMTRDTAIGLARWRELARSVALGGAAVLAVVSALLWRMLRAERARRRAQLQMRERAAHTRALEQRLLREQKLDALGTLAGGVAHDINNILAAVTGYGEMAREAAAPASAQARHLDQVLQAAQRGKAVIERILGFSRGGLRPAAVFAVQPVVEQVLGLLGGALDARVRIERDIANEPLHVRGDATALFEAVMNLGTNALQAMPEGGVLRVSVQALAVTSPRDTSHGHVEAGAHVCFAIADTGLGITAAVMERLFEPFFTTRGRAGTGLGLAVVHTAVQEFRGAIDVHSTPGRGSRFELLLPAVAAPAEPVGGFPTEATDDLPAGQGQTVLVVDDEPALVALAEELLAQMGYEPVGCSDPLQAIEELRAQPRRFDLVITDEVMPGLSGTELATRLKALRADLPILLLTGYGGPLLAQRARDAGIARVLAKPLQREQLAQAVAQALG